MTQEQHKTSYYSALWKLMTFMWVMLGAIGIVLPLIPTTPFLLLAAWSAPKASPKLEKWLYNHPKFGPPLHAWRDERAVSPKAQWTALILMCMSWGFLYYMHGLSFVFIMVGGIFISTLTYLFSLPTPNSNKNTQ